MLVLVNISLFYFTKVTLPGKEIILIVIVRIFALLEVCDKTMWDEHGTVQYFPAAFIR